ncbi:MAG: metallophosphoesterase [Balneolales bacterium]
MTTHCSGINQYKNKALNLVKPVAGLIAFFSIIILHSGCNEELPPLGQNEAIRTYIEFADGGNRGMYDPETDSKGYPDEDYDATTAMVINWHRLPESDAGLDARMWYRQIHPDESSWKVAEGESFEFWHRDEKINRVLIKDLDPNSVYEYVVSDSGAVFRFHTMPSSLDERPVKLIMTSDHQSPTWPKVAHDNAKMAAIQQPDMFVIAGDFVNDEGEVNSKNADKWVTYLDYMFNIEDGYFLIDKEIDGDIYENVIIPHVGVMGNHETGEEHHIRWPADLYTVNKSYPKYVASNWMELLFHWPYSSEGFYSEFNPDHPNMNQEIVQEGFGKGGFGKLSFSDYLLLIGMDNSQNWEGVPDEGLRDWEGNLITDEWPWFETQHAEVRQDIWLNNLLEPEDGPTAGESYTHILPVWHRGLFGTVRMNMTFKNRNLLKYWLPVLYRNGVKLITEGHDHNYTRTVPMEITLEQPENTYMEAVYYEPTSWESFDGLDEDYLDQYFSVNTINDNETREIIGWEYDGNYITYGEEGMIAMGHGGWAAGRRNPGHRGGGNAGLWFVDDNMGAETFGGKESFHMNTVVLTNDGFTVDAYQPDQLIHFKNGTDPKPIHRFRWVKNQENWLAYDFESNKWIRYESFSTN